MLASPMTVPTMPPLPLRVLVLAIAMIVLVPLASAGCPHQGQELQVVAPLSTTDEDADRLLREADRAANEGRVEEAVARYREIVARHGQDRIVPLAYLGLGRVAVGLGRYDEALRELEQAARGGDPVVNERAALYRGVALHLSARSDEAVPVLAPLLGSHHRSRGDAPAPRHAHSSGARDGRARDGARRARRAARCHGRA